MDHPKGIIAPLLTPFNNDGSIADDLWQAHAVWILDQGAHYLSPFGTTGEALSVPMDARMAGLAGLLDAGIAPDKLMPGTGMTSLGDTVVLIKHAMSLGITTVMVLPSFFYLEANEDGHFRYFEALVTGVADDRLKICLYNIPQNTGVSVPAQLAARLNREFPDVFVAYKDSTGKWDNTLSVIETAPGISVFPGTEALMVKAMDHGGGGCISATVNLNARAIRAVYDAKLSGDDVTAANDTLLEFRKILQDAGLIRGLKSIFAVQSGDARWLNLRPPLLDATLEMGHKLLAELGPLAVRSGGVV